MSVIVAALVWQLKPRTMISNQKLLLVSLADQSNDDGLTVFLTGGTKELAERCEFGFSTCRRLLDRLAGEHWIAVAVEQSHHRPRQYQLNLEKLRAHQKPPRGLKSSTLTKKQGAQIEHPDQNRGLIHESQGAHLESQGAHLEGSGGSNGASHIRKYVLHEDYMGRGHGDGLRPPPLFSASPGTGNGSDLAYRKLSEICMIQLPPSGREFNLLQGALVVLRDKMLADLGDSSASPITEREAVTVITKLATYWKSEDWRGKKGEAPSPIQLVESYGAAKVWAKT